MADARSSRRRKRSRIPARVPKGTPAITIQQPWASLIVEGHKKIENRSWTTAHRGLLIIHAGMKLDHDALAKHRRRLRNPDDLPQGCLLGTVELTDCTEGSRSPWAEPGYFHWRLKNPRRFRSPIRMGGKLGLWQPSRR
jgi:hypothetical protein